MLKGGSGRHKKGLKKDMTDRSYSSQTETRRTGQFGRWLGSRPAESWIFFAAGLFFGGLFF